MSAQPTKHIERSLRVEHTRAEATQNIKTYLGFCVHRDDSSTRPSHNTLEDRIAAHRSMTLEFISIVCERVPLLPIEAAIERYDFTVSGIEIPIAIDLPKSMSIQWVRISPSTSYQDAKNMVRRIQAAVGDLAVHEIQAGRNPLSELLPVGGWHPVNPKFKLIHFQKDSIYEEFQPQDCVMPSCVICGGTAKKKEEQQQHVISMKEENKLQ
jgi:hypothetical protein